MCAAGGGHTDVVQVLLSRHDVGINMRDKVCLNGNLHWISGLLSFVFPLMAAHVH